MFEWRQNFACWTTIMKAKIEEVLKEMFKTTKLASIKWSKKNDKKLKKYNIFSQSIWLHSIYEHCKGKIKTHPFITIQLNE